MAKTAVRVHNDIPWNKVAKMWDDGKTYEHMAKAIDRFNPKSEDPTKPMRAIVSRGLKVGFKDANGKLVKLERREGMRAFGGKTVHKKAHKPTASKPAAQKGTGKGRKMQPTKAVLITSEGDGKFVRIEAEQKKMLVPASKYLKSTINVLDSLGYTVVAKPPEETKAAETAPTANPAEVEQVNQASEQAASDKTNEVASTTPPPTQATGTETQQAA